MTTGSQPKTIRSHFTSGELMQKYSVNEYEQKHGLSLHWYKNGQLMSVLGFYNDLAEGLLKEWTEDGLLIRCSEFHNGKLHGYHQSWWDDGVIKEEGVYVEDKRQIGYRWYSPSGELWQVFEDKDIQK